MPMLAAGGLLAGVSDAAGQANALMARLNDLVANNEDSLRRTITNVELFTTTLAERKDDVAATAQGFTVALRAAE